MPATGAETNGGAKSTSPKTTGRKNKKASVKAAEGESNTLLYVGLVAVLAVAGGVAYWKINN